MSENHLHVHAPHEESLHKQAHAAHHSLSQWVAIFTALLAALGAIVSYQGSHLMDEVLLHKNEAVLLKAHATDQWNYYQAISTKLHLMQLGELLAPGKDSRITVEIDKYQHQKLEIQHSAQDLEQKSAAENAEARALNRPHLHMAMSLIFLQIAISLASITALTGRRWLLWGGVVSALAGMGLWGWALLSVA